MAIDGKHPLTGADFIRAVKDALGIDVLGQRVIIDAKCDKVVTVYFQGVGDTRLLQLDLETLLRDVKPVFVDAQK